MDAHKYEMLYKLSPKAYDFLYSVRKKTINFLFIRRNRKFIAKNLDVNEDYRKEYENLMLAINSKDNSDLESPFGLYLYDLVRKRKPNVFLETGVRRGFSSRLILEAMAKNGSGLLVSTEISSGVGELVTENLKSRWKLIIADEKEVLANALSTINKIDIFLHDSNHGYEAMKAEFDAIKEKMQSDGTILSDDIEENNAFMEFAVSRGKNPLIIPGAAECFGIIYLKP